MFLSVLIGVLLLGYTYLFSLSIHMSNIFLTANIPHAPWHRKNEPGKTRGEPHIHIRDLHDEPVCRINTHNRNVNQNTRLIEHAPQLLAALIEYAYAAHNQGIEVDPALLDLIQAAGGPQIKIGNTKST